MNSKLLSNSFKEIIEEVFVNRSERYRIRANRYYNSARYLELSSILGDQEIELIIDIGANEGQFGESIRALGCDKELISFEPIPNAFDILNVKAKNDKNWRAFNLALGSQNTNKIFNIYQDSKLSSFFEGDGSTTSRFQNNFKESTKINVEVKRLDFIWPKIQKQKLLNKVVFKMDTQGYDLEVFRGIGKIKQSVKYILTELSVIPLYRNLPTYTEALQFYEQEGYGPLAFIPITRDHQDGRVIEFDCILSKKGFV
jgi:FkbM family methyltransferase